VDAEVREKTGYVTSKYTEAYTLTARRPLA